MRISQVENLFSSRNSPKFWKDLLHNLPAWHEQTIGCFAQDADVLQLANPLQPRKFLESSFQPRLKREQCRGALTEPSVLEMPIKLFSFSSACLPQAPETLAQI